MIFDKAAEFAIGKFGKVGVKIVDKAPEILAVSGVGCIIGGTVLACLATRKIDVIRSGMDEDLYAIHSAEEAEDMDYSHDDAKRDIAITYVKYGIDIVKTYVPAASTIALGVGCMLASNHILRTRLIAAGAAYKLLESTFRDYRKRVAESVGTEKEHDILLGARTIDVETTKTLKSGKEKTVVKKAKVVDPNDISPYFLIFDDHCMEWTKDAEINRFFLQTKQNYLNDRLRIEGFLFLNDVYRELGAPISQIGQQVGWLYPTDSEGNFTGDGDGFVDFGMFEFTRETKVDFANGFEKCILLDFNVDGYILDQI